MADSALRWRLIDPTIPSDLPEEPACYVVITDGVASYVGQTSNLRTRMRAHRIRPARYSSWWETPWGTFRDVVVKVRRVDRYGDWLMHEARLIRRLRPRFNQIGKPQPRGDT